MKAIRKNARALSLLEVLVTVGIISFLLSLLYLVSVRFIKRAELVKCMSHMRSLHTAFLAYVEDRGEWPQYDMKDNSKSRDLFRFYIQSLEEYGVSQDNWICPTDKIYRDIPEKDRPKFYSSYMMTQFDKGNMTPLRWNQPWLVERGNFHGKGRLILMPDGSITESLNPFFGR